MWFLTSLCPLLKDALPLPRLNLASHTWRSVPPVQREEQMCSELRNKSSGTYFQKAPTMSWCNCQLYRGITACLQSSCGSWNKSSLCTEHLLYASLQGIAEWGRFPSGQPTPVPCHPPSKVLPLRPSSYSEEFLPAWLGKQKHYLKHPRSGLWTVFLESSALLPRYRLESTLVIHLCKSFRAFYQATRCFICRPDSI